MGKIVVYNTKQDDFTSEPNNFYIGRNKDGNPLGNPFTHNGVKTNLAKLSFKTREQAIEAFGKYFDERYGKDEELTKAFDNIYEHYKNGEDIYLQCFCKPLPCHGDVIADRLQRKLIKEKLKERKKLKNTESL
jgi:hypothetical protein